MTALSFLRLLVIPDPDDMREPPEDEEEEGNKKLLEDSILDRSCFIFGEASFLRRTARAAASSQLFEIGVLLLIAGNSLTLAMYDPMDPDGDANQLLNQIGTVFTILFAVEMFTKIIAYGLIFGDGSYLRNEK